MRGQTAERKCMALETGAIYEGTVKSITQYGALVEVRTAEDEKPVTGMVHISEVANAFVRDIRDFLNEGDKVGIVGINGTGKSTHTKLWRRYLGDRAVMVNDDKPLIIIREDGVRICGTPWNGKHNLGENIILPLKAICSLSRAEETHIEKVSFEEMLPVLFKQTYRSSSPQKIAKTMQLLNTLSKHVDFYKLGCNMKRSAARIAYNGMKD